MQSPAQLLPPAEMGTAQQELFMWYFVTTYDVCADDYASRYTTKFFKTHEAFIAYAGKFEDHDVYGLGALNAEQQEYYQRLCPFWS